jgi:tripartite-type tricarboxylate transporter receptor subunit TctC
MKSMPAAFIALLLAAVPTAAQTAYPQNNILLLYGFPAGTDTGARVFADKLAEVLGKPVVVDNVTGAAGNIAADCTAKARPDGYTIGMLTGANITINATLYKKLPYDPVRDLIPVSLIFSYANVLMVNSQVPAKNVEELVTLAKAQPGQLSFGPNGIGTSTHLSAEIFQSMAGIKIQEVPYRGAPPLLTDLVSGRITMTFNTPTVTLPLAREGKLRALAVTSRTRVPFAPDLPTMNESGFPGFNTTVWFGLFVPAGTPTPIVETLNREAVRIMSLPDVRRRLFDLGLEPRSSTPKELADMIKAETPYWANIIKNAGLTPIE